MPTSEHPTDLELLGLRADAVGDRIAGLRGVRLLCTRTNEAFAVGSAVPPDLAKALDRAYRQAPAASVPTAFPPALQACERLLTANGYDVHRSASVVWLIEPGTAFTSDAPIERSDRPAPDWMRQANPGNWHPTEYDELLDGHLGPWAMATRGHRIISMCHAPVVMTDCFAECGVWTHPDFRGQGNAAAVTAAWAALLRPSNRHLFYSTAPDNHASHRVTQRLKLRSLGHHFALSESDDEPGDHLHPLSRAKLYDRPTDT